MKSLKYFFGALLIGAIAFSACNKDPKPEPDPDPDITGDLPEVAAVPGKIVLVLNCVEDAQVCHDLVFAGDYNGWKITPADMVKFVPIADFDGWYKAEITPTATPEDPNVALRGKPNQLASDGSFPSSWDYQWFAQMKDGAVANECEIIQGDASLYDEYNGEKGLSVNVGANVVYIRAYAWKKNPCIPAEKYTITFNATVPDGLGSDDVVYIVGGMNDWTVDANPMTKSGNTWSITLNDIEFDTEYKYVVNGSWTFEELRAAESGADCATQTTNRKVNDRTMTDIVENFRLITIDRCGDGTFPDVDAVAGQITIFAKFETAPCGEVGLVGTNNGWSDDPDNLPRFIPARVIEGKDWGAAGWWEITIDLTDDMKFDWGGDKNGILSGKPIQLTEDGEFNWDYEAVTTDAEILAGGVNVIDGDVIIRTNTTAVFIFKAWKTNPCAEPVPAGNGTFTVTITSEVEEDAEIIFTGNFADKAWGDSDRIMTLSDGKYTWTGAYPENFVCKVIKRIGEDVTWASGDNQRFDGENFEFEFSFPE